MGTQKIQICMDFLYKLRWVGIICVPCIVVLIYKLVGSEKLGIKQTDMKGLNLLKEYPQYYSSKKTPEIVEVGKAKFISIRAKGSFLDQIFYDRIEVLTHAANEVKGLYENSDQAFQVSVLEGLYWYDEKKYG